MNLVNRILMEPHPTLKVIDINIMKHHRVDPLIRKRI